MHFMPFAVFDTDSNLSSQAASARLNVATPSMSTTAVPSRMAKSSMLATTVASL